MKRSTASRTIRICRRNVLLFFAVVVATSAGAQIEKQQIPANSEGTSEQSGEDRNAVSKDNALAQPSGDNSTPSFRGRVLVQAESNAWPRSAINDLIRETVHRMPTGGDYRASSESIQKLESAIKNEGNHLAIDAAVAKPSFCSSATYLVFVLTLEELYNQRRIEFQPGVAEKLLVRGQNDGVGVWGFWNANGPGTARLFEKLRLGNNFLSIEKAQAGDFLKIFWNDQIGSKEFGHSVVYLGHGPNAQGVDTVQFWSSNKKGGYGCAEVPRSKIKRMLFSRLTHPEQINQIGELPTDEYLASMLDRSSTPEEMYRMVGISQPAEPIPTPALGTDNGSRPERGVIDPKRKP